MEAVVTFKNEKRTVAMYFTEIDGNLDMQMSMDPEFNEGEEPDLPLLLAGVLMDALNVDKSQDEEKPKILTN